LGLRTLASPMPAFIGLPNNMSKHGYTTHIVQLQRISTGRIASASLFIYSPDFPFFRWVMDVNAVSSPLSASPGLMQHLTAHPPIPPQLADQTPNPPWPGPLTRLCEGCERIVMFEVYHRLQPAPPPAPVQPAINDLDSDFAG